MKHIRISLIDNDFTVQAAADIDFHDNQDRKFAAFLTELSDQLITGDTASVEIEGLGRPVRFTVAEVA